MKLRKPSINFGGKLMKYILTAPPNCTTTTISLKPFAPNPARPCTPPSQPVIHYVRFRRAGTDDGSESCPPVLATVTASHSLRPFLPGRARSSVCDGALAAWIPNPTVRAQSRFPNPTVRAGSAGGLERGTVASRTDRLREFIYKIETLSNQKHFLSLES
jgi:hypothetical protein